MTDASQNIFGEWLGAALRSRRLNAAEFSERAKISRAAIYFYLDGSRVPDEPTLAKMLGALGVSHDSLPSFKRKPIGRPRSRTEAA